MHCYRSCVYLFDRKCDIRNGGHLNINEERVNVYKSTAGAYDLVQSEFINALKSGVIDEPYYIQILFAIKLSCLYSSFWS